MSLSLFVLEVRQFQTTIRFQTDPTESPISRLVHFHSRRARWTTRIKKAERGFSIPETFTVR
jgi:hypothetical protein